ncbi:MAG TPA: energy transducer TonB [Ignavibacteriaceae bacterium]|nr:energy transducer TonB [Ignavibacteriaceae bacterium]
MDRLNKIELIQLYTAGCISQPDKIILKSLMENDENFPWAELAEFQNLIAILPSTINPETPSHDIKEEILMKMNKVLLGEEIVISESKVSQKAPVMFEEQLRNNESKSKIDWGSFSVVNSSSEKSQTPEKIEEQPTIISDAELQEDLSDTSSHLVFEVVSAPPEKPDKAKLQERFSALQGIRKYALAFGVVIVLAVVIFSYFNLVKTSDDNYLQPEIEKPVNVSVAQEDATIDDSVQEFVIPENVQLIEEEEQAQTKEQVIKQILPTPPPELPMPIETPVAEFAGSNSVEDETEQKDITQVNEQSALPPKEETEIEEETVYFVAVEEMPEPLGGLKSIQEKIVYPEIAKRAGVEGKVFVKAFVDETGMVTSAEIVKGIGAGCDEAAIDAVLQTKFSPGKQRGRPIKVQVTIPIVFKL